MTLQLWLAFVVAACVVALSPGPGAVLSMSVGLRHGYRHAIVAILGLQTALLVQLTLVGVGLGALLAASEAAFLAVKLAGAAYLVWLGIQKWRATPDPGGVSSGGESPRGFYVQGLLVNLGNPKAIVFIAALVPPFIDPALPRLPQFAIVGATMCSVDIAVMSAYALLAGRLSALVRGPAAARLQNRVFGSIFVAAGLGLAAASR